jgi:hypothetical protein
VSMQHRFPCNTLTHSINEDLLNIKRKGDPEVSVQYLCKNVLILFHDLYRKINFLPLKYSFV